jgi:hypothetical protein
MKVEVELPRSLVEGLEWYSEFCRQSLDETVRQILGDFMFGINEDRPPPGDARSASP